MKKAQVHLSNGEIAHITIYLEELESWLASISDRGLRTEDSFFPFHSIVYILFQDEAYVSDSEGNGTTVVKAPEYQVMKEAD